MTKHVVKAEFEGSTYFVVDTDEYPHYFKEGRGGLERLQKDLFFDFADFEESIFEEGSTEITHAYFTPMGEVSE